MEVYEIDLLRALFVDKLNDSSIFLASFYEQTQDQEQISRYVDTIKDLIALQNREKSESDYKAMGIISQSGDAEILNIKTNYIVPTGYQVRLDIELSDRDYVLQKIKTLINDLRGRKFEVMLKSDGEIIVFDEPTINTSTNKLNITNNSVFWFPLNSDINENDLTSNSSFLTDFGTIYTSSINVGSVAYVYGKFALQAGDRYARIRITNVPIAGLRVTEVVVIGNDENGTQPQLYKMSLSFNGVQSQEPYINNGLDRVFLFFGGNVTITDQNVMLGNDIVKTTIQVGKNTGTIYDVEPNEIPASLALDSDGYGEWDTGYQSKERNLGVSNKLSYTFVYDRRIALYNDLYRYSRYGALSSTYSNQEFTIKEYRYSFGQLIIDTFYAKLGEINTSNTNGDVMTLSITFKVGAY